MSHEEITQFLYILSYEIIFVNVEMTGMVDKLTKMPANWARVHGFMYFKGKKTGNLKRFKLHPNCQEYPAKM